MEQSFKAREEELSQAIQQKKRFLWGLARSLRDQHAHLTRAMTDVRRQTEHLTAKESGLKTQLEEAEQILKKRGEDMRNQISEELIILEGHLASMKKERDSINEERKEIENIKNVETNAPTEKVLKPEYDLLKTELSILRKYIEATKLEPKCVIERGTVTDFGIKCFMNNENIGIKMEKIETNRVVNDFKKQNNINFSQSNLDDIKDIKDIISGRPSAVSSVGDMRDETEGTLDGAIMDVDKGYIRDKRLRVGNIKDGAPGDTRGQESDVDTLRQENDRLKSYAKQQREYIEALFKEKDSLQRALTDQSRPRTAPVVSNYIRGHRLIPEAKAPCPRSPAGEPETREWRMRRVSGTSFPLHAADEVVSNFSENDTDIRRTNKIKPRNTSNATQQPNQLSVSRTTKIREKSPKSLLRETKENLRNNTVKQTSQKSSDNSSDAMLREAKRRLRKLEIEAEAVEKSYQDFRKRQTELREERRNIGHVRDNLIEKAENLDVKHKVYENYENKSTCERNQPSSFPKESRASMKNDFDKYFKEYTAKLDLSQLRFANKNSVIENVKPIPAPFGNKKEVNYLETPLMEFRKLYQGQRRSIENKMNIVKDDETENKYSESNIKIVKAPNIVDNTQKDEEIQDDIMKTSPKPKLVLETNMEGKDNLLNNNIDRLSKDDITIKEIDNNKNNLLMVEVENGCDNTVVPERSQGLLIVVESSVDNRDVSDVEGEQIRTQMTIIVSPKNTGGSKDLESPIEIRSRDISPELSQMNVLKPIHADNKELSSVDSQLEMSKEHVESISEVEKNQDDRLDDFSADVDNYNSPLEYGNNSPISLPKTSEDENFW